MAVLSAALRIKRLDGSRQQVRRAQILLNANVNGPNCSGNAESSRGAWANHWLVSRDSSLLKLMVR